jgi:hypothetical protein
MPVQPRTWAWITAFTLTAAVWGLNAVWLQRDTRPPIWDMALHQSYALNYLPPAPGTALPGPLVSRSGNHPPFVHLVIALCYTVFHPGPHVAVLANIPATLLLFWSVYMLGLDLAGLSAARWACLLTALTPYLIWMSRETVLDYWLAAWVAAAFVVLRRTNEFRSRSQSILFGLICALGLLTKWLFAGFLLVPLLYVCVRSRIWRDETRMVFLADAMLIGGLLAGIWYLPNLPNLVRYFVENAKIGAREGEPPVFSFQSLIYYLRLLEGYQLFGILFLLLTVSAVFVWRRNLMRHGMFLVAAVLGGWAAMTLLRTKDPRFTMPLLGPLFIVAGAWLQAWRCGWAARAAKAGLVAVLCLQAYAANFGVTWLPQEVVLARGYTGSLRWDWNLFLQHYFHILGAPRREDWRLEEILRRIDSDARMRGVQPDLALIPDLPRFNSANFLLLARLQRLSMRIDHIQAEAKGIQSFEGYNYVIMTEGDQGMTWSTASSRALNQVIVDDPGTFQLVELYQLPDGNGVRLYFIRRGDPERPKIATVLTREGTGTLTAGCFL